MQNSTLRLLIALLMVGFFAACSRPTAYFQPAARESFSGKPVTTLPTVAAEATPVTTSELSSVPTAEVAQANAALDQMEAVVRNDATLSADKTVQKRLNRVRTMLASASAKTALTPASSTTPQKANLMQRLMLKKMDRKINRQLAPRHPDKAMANTGILAAGAVVVIVGLILILATSASGLGVILLLAGAVILLVGLL